MVQDFPTRLRSLCEEHNTSVELVGNAAYDPLVKGTSLGMLRKVLAGDRAPNIALMQNVAAALGLPPTVFAEYQLATARARLDERAVGLAEAYGNLEAIIGALRDAGLTPLGLADLQAAQDDAPTQPRPDEHLREGRQTPGGPG